jgi:hypothetical protein
MKTTVGKIRDSILWGDTVSTGDNNKRPLRAKGPWGFLLRRHSINPLGMKMKDHWGQNPWKFSLRRHGINPLGIKMKNHWGQNPWKLSLRRHGINPLGWKWKTTESKIHENSLWGDME